MTEPAVTAGLHAYSQCSLPGRETSTGLGAVFTRRWVVDLILDLAGYTADEDLAAYRAVEPSCGPGAFVVSMVERLHASCHHHGRDILDAGEAIIAFDVDPAAVRACRYGVTETLVRLGIPDSLAGELARRWIRGGDFLQVAAQLHPVRWVVGNPPYVRVEEVDRDLMASYRAMWPTMSGRADLYVGFLEAGLGLLAPEGRLAFICADRWMRNRYGAALRNLVEDQYAMDVCLVMHDVNAFDRQVSAYPAITVLRAGVQRPALVCEARASFDGPAAGRLLSVWTRGPAPVAVDLDYRASWTTIWFSDGDSWPAGTPERLTLLSELETKFPTLVETGARISVGVATGADDVYLISDPGLVERDRVIPVVGAREITAGSIEWAGRYLVNPWVTTGLVSLEEYPKLRSYLHENADRIKARHVAKQRPGAWWRTIDRVDMKISATPKLLVPDLKDRVHPILDTGCFYPLHNLYYLVAPTWDLEVLGGLLLSDVANLFVESYSVRMANGYLRVGAQYLRRIRTPQPERIEPSVAEHLRQAFRRRDIEAASRAALTAYGIDDWPSS